MDWRTTQSLCEAAYMEITNTLNPPAYEAGTVESLEVLRELWQIDKKAYGDHSLEFEPFLEWWNLYPHGSRCLFLKDKIVASIGIYPLSVEQSQAFRDGHLVESELRPVSIAQCAEEGVQDWYVSGIVVVDEWQNRGLVRPLIRSAIENWMNSGHIHYPVRLFSLGQTLKGVKALKLFGLEFTTSGDLLPDQLDMYYMEKATPAELRECIW